jgi:hypothetical protein
MTEHPARVRRRVLLALVLAGLHGCVTPPSPISPLFVADPAEAQRYRTIARDQDHQLGTCGEQQACERLHYTRALLALYENRALAAQHFQALIAVNPNGRLASSSLLWLNLLKDAPTDPGRSNPFAKATESLARDLIERELMLQQLSRESDVTAIRSLQQGIKTRDKQVEELTRQLNALKRIDQELKEKEKARQKKPSGNTKPSSDGASPP